MYSLTDYLGMVADRTRKDAFVAALEATVRPGMTVIDLGAGPAIFALIAARLGAEKVYAIEPDASIEAGPELASVNGLDSRIEFIRDLSTSVTLPEKADLIVADLAGVVPLMGKALPSLIDARERLLAETGTLVPARDTLHVALAETHRPFPFDRGVLDELGLDLSRATRVALNAPGSARMEADELLSTSVPWASLAYSEIEGSHAQGEGRVTATRDGTANALCLWFQRELLEGITFSTAPGQARTVYAQAALPFENPIEVTAGESIDVSVEARFAGGDYVWRWQTTTCDRSESHATDQSSLLARTLSLNSLAKRESTYVPRLRTDGEIDGFVLSRMTGALSLREIANELLDRFPTEVRDANDALGRVAAVSARYSL